VVSDSRWAGGHGGCSQAVPATVGGGDGSGQMDERRQVGGRIERQRWFARAAPRGRIARGRLRAGGSGGDVGGRRRLWTSGVLSAALVGSGGQR